MSIEKSFVPDDFYDFIVIGGGPAGAVFSTLMAKEGYKVIVLEGSKFPRFCVGEIIAPTAIWRIWHRLGVTKEMMDPLFIQKWGAGWITPNGTQFNFDQDVHPEDSRCHAHVYQLDRSVYDEFLLNHARDSGATALEEAKVQELFYDENGRMNGVSFERHGETFKVRSKLVVDASGRTNFIPRKLGIRMEIEELHSFACFAHWEDCKKDQGKNAGDVRLLFTENDLWYWWAPLKDPKSSIGVVADKNVHWNEYSKDPEAFYEKWVWNHPFIKKRIENATRVTGFDAVKTKINQSSKDSALLTNFHARSSKAVGDGWVLIGDTLGFVDPVFSAGLHVVHGSGMILADAVIKGMKENNLSEAFLEKEYHEKYKEEFQDVLFHIQGWAQLYYNPKFVDMFLKWGNRYPKIRDMYIRTFIAFEKKAIKEFSKFFLKIFKNISHKSGFKLSVKK